MECLFCNKLNFIILFSRASPSLTKSLNCSVGRENACSDACVGENPLPSNFHRREETDLSPIASPQLPQPQKRQRVRFQ